jgi:hypothetical protein
MMQALRMSASQLLPPADGAAEALWERGLHVGSVSQRQSG